MLERAWDCAAKLSSLACKCLQRDRSLHVAAAIWGKFSPRGRAIIGVFRGLSIMDGRLGALLGPRLAAARRDEGDM